MCQLGAVVFSRQRVFRQDGIRSHRELNPLAKKKWPREKFHNAEYDFVNREWGMANGDLVEIPNWAMPMLKRFEQENWANADMLMNFVLHAGEPEDRILTIEANEEYIRAEIAAKDEYYRAIKPAEDAYNEVRRPVQAAYDKAVNPAEEAYDKAMEEAEAIRGDDYNAYLKAMKAADGAYSKAVDIAEAAYDKILEPAEAAFFKAIKPAEDAYDKECAYAWCAIFAKPENRIPIWREE